MLGTSLHQTEESLTIPPAESELPFLSEHDRKFSQNIQIENLNDADLPVKSNKAKVRSHYLGVLYTILAMMCLSLSSTVLRKYRHIHPFNLGTWAFPVAAFLTAPLVFKTVCLKKKPVFNNVWPIHKNKKTVFFTWFRAVTSSGVVYLMALTVRYISVGDARTIAASSVITVSLFGWLCLGESCGVVPFVVAIIALLGIGIMTRPPLLTGAESFDENTLIGVLLALVWVMFLTAMIITIRYLKKVHYVVLNTFLYVWCFAQSFILAVSFGEFQVPQNWSDAFAMIITGTLISLGSTFLVLALQKEEAGVVALIRTSDVVITFFWQWVLLGEAPDWISILGACLVVSGVLAVTFRKYISSLPQDHDVRVRCSFLLQ